MSGISIGSGYSIGDGLIGDTGLSKGSGLYFNGFTPTPVLNLNFLSGSLDSRITFSRPSLATMYDSTGKLTYAPNNLVPNGTTSTSWVGGSITTGVSDPVGGTNAMTLTATANNQQIYRPVGTQTSANAIVSVWAKRRTGSGTVSLYNAQAVSTTAMALTTSWQQFYVLQSPAPTTAWYFDVLFATSGDAIDIYLPCVSSVTYETTPRTQDQVLTTGSAYYGPRFDYNPVTLAARGLLIEETRTNSVPYSQQLNAAGWITTASSVTADATTAPDGTSTADLIVPDTTNTFHRIYQGGSSLAGTAIAISFYAKAGGYSQVGIRENSATGASVAFTLSGSGSATTPYNPAGATISNAQIESLPNSWYRCSFLLTFSPSNTASVSIQVLNGSYASGDLNSYLWTGDGTSGVYVWGVQMEAGSFATSYIPTGASSVARSADSVSMTGTNFSSWYNQSEGTFVAQADGAEINNYRRVIYAGFGTDNISMAVGPVQSFLSQSSAAGAIFQPSVTGYVVNVPFRAAFGYKAADYAASLDGSTATTGTTAGAIATISQLGIGQNIGAPAQFLCGHIASLSYYRTRLTNTQIQALSAWTTPTAALSLNFTTGTLDNRITFSRPSLATLYDSTGKLTFAPNNILTGSNSFSNVSYWSVQTNLSFTTGISDPAGGTAATTLTATLANARLTTSTLSAGWFPTRNFIISVWARRRSGTGTVTFEAAQVGVGPTINLTENWQLFTYSGTNSATGIYPGIRINTSGDQVDIYNFAVSAVTYETTARAQDQVITTASAYYGPRFDYNPTPTATGNGIELVSNGSFTNSSNWVTGAGWSISGDKAVASVVGYNSLTQSIPTLQPGSIYQVSYDVVLNSGTLAVYLGNSGSAQVANGLDVTSGSKVIFGTADSLRQIVFRGNPTFNGTVDNVSVQMVVYNPRGLLIEETRTNVLLQSNAFTTAPWASLSASTIVTPNSVTGPDGTTSGCLIQTIANTVQFGVYQTFTYTSATYTFSAYAKAGTYSYLALDFENGSAFGAVFNLSNGTVGYTDSGTGTTAAITSVGNGWYRCSITATRVAGAQYPEIYLSGSGTANTRTWTAAGTENLYIYGMQLEVGSFATSYIPTGSASVARSADSVSMTGANFSSWFNQNEGAFYALFDTNPAVSVGSGRIIGFQGSVTPVYVSSSTSLGVYNGLVTNPNATLGSGTVASQTKVAMSYIDGVYTTMAANAGTVGTSTNDYSLISPNSLWLGSNVGSGAFMCGHITVLNYYSSYLRPKNLQTLTT